MLVIERLNNWVFSTMAGIDPDDIEGIYVRLLFGFFSRLTQLSALYDTVEEAPSSPGGGRKKKTSKKKKR